MCKRAPEGWRNPGGVMKKPLPGEDKTVCMGLYKLADCCGKTRGEGSGTATVRIDAKELSGFLGWDRRHSRYAQIGRLADGLAGSVFPLYDAEGTLYGPLAEVAGASYSDGDMRITFRTDGMGRDDLERTVRELPYETVKWLCGEYSLRLYRMLKGMWLRKSFMFGDAAGWAERELPLGRLKMELGAVDTASRKAAAYFAGHPFPETDDGFAETVERIEDGQYRKYGNFVTRCLARAAAEVNELTDMEVSYSGIRKGLGGKTAGMLLTARRKDAAGEKTAARGKQEKPEDGGPVQKNNDGRMTQQRKE